MGTTTESPPPLAPLAPRLIGGGFLSSDRGCSGAMTGAVLISWLPQIGLPLGDSHEGRILARLGMQAANVWRLGLVGSGWGTVLQPYDANGIYAHHPPLVNLLHVVAAGILGGDQPWHLRVPGYLAGLATRGGGGVAAPGAASSVGYRPCWRSAPWR